MFSVHTKTQSSVFKMFSVHTKTQSSVFKMFSVHTKTQSSVFKFLCFQESFRKAPFSVDNFSGLVWTEGPTGEIKLRFEILPAQCGRGLRDSNIAHIRKVAFISSFFFKLERIIKTNIFSFQGCLHLELLVILTGSSSPFLLSYFFFPMKSPCSLLLQLLLLN